MWLSARCSRRATVKQVRSQTKSKTTSRQAHEDTTATTPPSSRGKSATGRTLAGSESSRKQPGAWPEEGAFQSGNRWFSHPIKLQLLLPKPVEHESKGGRGRAGAGRAEVGLREAVESCLSGSPQATAGLGASLLERVGQGVWLITPTPSKAKLRRMEAAGAGGAGVERGRPLGLPWGWCPPACRGAAPLGVGPSAYCPGERAIVGTWSAALIGIGKSLCGASLTNPRPGRRTFFAK